MRIEERHLTIVSEIKIRSKEPSTSWLGQDLFRLGIQFFFGIKRREKLGKHRKFDNLWMGPYIIYDVAFFP